MLKDGLFRLRSQPTLMEIRPCASRYCDRIIGLLIGLVLSGLLFLYFRGDFPGAAPEEVTACRTRVGELENLVTQSDGALTHLQVSESARQQLTEELRELSDRHALLNADLSHALRLVPVGGPEGSARLDRFAVRPDANTAHLFHFSVLVGYESGRHPQEFSGTLQFVLTVSRNGQQTQLSLPASTAEPEVLEKYRVLTRHWTRKTGTLEILPGDILRKVEIRLTQGGVQRAAAAIDL